MCLVIPWFVTLSTPRHTSQRPRTRCEAMWQLSPAKAHPPKATTAQTIFHFQDSKSSHSRFKETTKQVWMFSPLRSCPNFYHRPSPVSLRFCLITEPDTKLPQGGMPFLRHPTVEPRTSSRRDAQRCFLPLTAQDLGSQTSPTANAHPKWDDATQLTA